MNGRTCQLCGKSLSRIWPGSDGDFCSREHRNQYRLRCGMDTLLEANKHASLMRRRDHLRHFPVTQLQCNPATAPRAGEPGPWMPLRPVLRRAPGPAVPAQPSLKAAAGGFAPLVQADDVKAEWRAAQTAALKRSAIVRRPEAMCPQSGIARAGFKRGLYRSSEAGGRRRGYFSAARDRNRVKLLSRSVQPSDWVRSGGLVGRWRATPGATAVPGHVFRVSGTAGFRPAALRLRRCDSPAPACTGMAWPDILPVSGRDIEAHASQISSELRIQPPGALLVGLASEIGGVSGLPVSGTMTAASHPAYENRMESRPAGWARTNAAGEGLVPAGQLRAGQTAPGPGYLKVKVRPSAVAPQHRLERAAFQAPEQPWIAVPNLWDASR